MNIFAIAWDSIWHHRTRSFLTALGIIIGVFAVVTLTSLGGGVQKYVNQKFAGVGANLITVMPVLPSVHQKGHQHKFGGGGGFASVPSALTPTDVHDLNHSGKSVIRSAAGVITVPDLLNRPHQQPISASIMGVSSPYFSMQKLTVKTGSLTGSGIVLGQKAAKELFGRQSALNKTVVVNNQAFIVTGVLKSAQGSPGSDPDNTAYLPLSKALSVSGQKTVSEIIVAASSPQTVSQAVTDARHILLKNHPSHNFHIITAQEILNTVTSTTKVITDFLAGIAGISLLVGGIGIMNIMLVTVSERFREIGIRKALGARDGDILVQFLTESVLLALIGGFIGTILAGLATHVVGKAVGIPANLTTSSVVTAVLFSIGVGALFGVLPAMRAARLMPAEALRTE
ncbi:ABC transporter permease [Sulfobacillus harzensis]|uniref:FtsX-like permease family protein n=1 Tax=Sulfobacillus harzensis TaxID=2729629 RepID=A0A7Y0L3A3_9FIRM|nr:ABC transporter permease [Sulfobacillus harzensis]NMP22177.1 FtsX-like permease family protein [Sulfobacillus harzensis]